jgi:DNA modification methylase
MRKCKEHGIKPHPARFPRKFPEFFLKFLTDENDLIIDPFAGSNTTGCVAENLRRRWLAFEIEESYIQASRFRFQSDSYEYGVEDEEMSAEPQLKLFSTGENYRISAEIRGQFS